MFLHTDTQNRMRCDLEGTKRATVDLPWFRNVVIDDAKPITWSRSQLKYFVSTISRLDVCLPLMNLTGRNTIQSPAARSPNVITSESLFKVANAFWQLA